MSGHLQCHVACHRFSCKLTSAVLLTIRQQEEARKEFKDIVKTHSWLLSSARIRRFNAGESGKSKGSKSDIGGDENSAEGDDQEDDDDEDRDDDEDESSVEEKPPKKARRESEPKPTQAKDKAEASEARKAKDCRKDIVEQNPAVDIGKGGKTKSAKTAKDCQVVAWKL